MSRRNRGYGWWTFGWIEAERKTKTPPTQAQKKSETKTQTWTWIILAIFGLLILLETLFGISK